jgi:hypothetical protein
LEALAIILAIIAMGLTTVGINLAVPWALDKLHDARVEATIKEGR